MFNSKQTRIFNLVSFSQEVFILFHEKETFKTKIDKRIKDSIFEVLKNMNFYFGGVVAEDHKRA